MRVYMSMSMDMCMYMCMPQYSKQSMPMLHFEPSESAGAVVRGDANMDAATRDHPQQHTNAPCHARVDEALHARQPDSTATRGASVVAAEARLLRRALVVAEQCARVLVLHDGVEAPAG